MGKLGINRRKSRLLAALLAFVLPGAGHLYTGHYQRGLLLLAGLLLDAAAIIRLADANGARHLLFIVYLGIALPVFFFISVYDALQSIERTAEQPSSGLSAASGLLIMAAGILLLVLIKPPAALIPWMNELADFAVGPVLMVAAVLLLIGHTRGGEPMFKLGRFTSAILIIGVGALLLWDQIQGRNDIALLGQWWPFVFILLGAEITVYSVAARKSNKRLRLDVVGGMMAIVIAASAYVVTQYAELPFRWLDQYVDIKGTADYAEEKGYHYTKEQITVPFDSTTSVMKITNPNGKVVVRAGEDDRITIETEVWVDVENQEEADKIADKTYVETDSEGDKQVISAIGEPYGTNGTRKPRINMIVTIPKLAVEEPIILDESETEEPNTQGDAEIEAAELELTAPANNAETDPSANLESGDEADPATAPTLSLSIDVSNGAIDVSGLVVPGGLALKGSSGDINVRDIVGSIVLKGNNGGITVSQITGSADVSTKNGTITVSGITGDMLASTVNGSLELNEVAGSIEAETKNGKIRIAGAGASIKADTLNGGIELISRVVGGDWDVDSSVGEIKLYIPENGDFSIYGSVTFGTITTDFPLTISKKTARGIVGAGTYRIQVNATNSIFINHYE